MLGVSPMLKHPILRFRLSRGGAGGGRGGGGGWYCTALYYTIYYTTLYVHTLYHTLLYYTLPRCASLRSRESPCKGLPPGRFDRHCPDSIGAFSSFQAAEGRAPTAKAKTRN